MPLQTVRTKGRAEEGERTEETAPTLDCVSRYLYDFPQVSGKRVPIDIILMMGREVASESLALAIA